MIEGDTFVSQRHARIYVVDGQPMVEDLGSTNGSFHNGNRLHGLAAAPPRRPGPGRLHRCSEDERQ